MSIGRVFFVFVFFVVVFNEYICFWWAFLRWPNVWKSMPAPDDHHLRVLFVADPQILGYNNEHYVAGPITRWGISRAAAATIATTTNNDN